MVSSVGGLFTIGLWVGFYERSDYIACEIGVRQGSILLIAYIVPNGSGWGSGQ